MEQKPLDPEGFGMRPEMHNISTPTIAPAHSPQQTLDAGFAVAAHLDRSVTA
jgi:hypothetical protein